MVGSAKEKVAGEEEIRHFSAWLGFAVREISPGRVVRIRPRWGRIATALLMLFMVAWLAKSIALYYFFKQVREFEDVAFLDMIAYPVNRGSVRVQQGNYQIAKAEEALQRSDYRRAFQILREGVVRSPANVKGRLLLAEIYSGWRPDLAVELMVDGVDEGIRDPEFLRAMMVLLMREKEDRTLLDISERLLGEDLDESTRQALLASRMQSAIFLGKFDLAREIFEATNMENTMDGLLMGTQIYEKTDRPGDAIDVLSEAKDVISDANASPVYNQLIRIYKDNGMYAEAREAALENMINHPLDWKPRVTLIDVLSASGLIERRNKEIASVVSEFRDDPTAMSTLAQLCADYGNVDAANRLYDVALESGYDLSLFSLTLAEAMVRSGQYRDAMDLCNQLINESPTWMPQVEGSFNAIRSLACHGAGEMELGNLYLNNFKNSSRATPGQLYQAALRYRDMGMDPQALVLLQESYRRDNRNERVLATLIEVEMSLGAFFSLETHIKDLLAMRRPDYDQVEAIYNGLLSDRFLFTGNRDNLLEGLEAILSEREQLQGWEIWVRSEPVQTG